MSEIIFDFPTVPQFNFFIDLQGQSLYQKWLQLGNVGTESDFLNWLKLDGDTMYEPIISSKGSAFNKNFGNTSGTVAEGNDSRLSDARSPLGGSSNYIQNQNTSAQSANMWISGSGELSTSFRVAYLPSSFKKLNFSWGGSGTFATIDTYNFQTGDRYPIAFQPDGGNVLIGTTSDNGSKLQVEGAATFSSSVTATNFITSSDETLKDIISTDGDVIRYKWKNKQDDLIHIGYSAQEKKSEYPDSVHENEEGLLSVSYVEILVDKIRKLEKRINELETN